MEPISVTHPMNNASNHHLRLRVLRADATHSLASLFGRKGVHQPPRLGGDALFYPAIIGPFLGSVVFRAIQRNRPCSRVPRSTGLMLAPLPSYLVHRRSPAVSRAPWHAILNRASQLLLLLNCTTVCEYATDLLYPFSFLHPAGRGLSPRDSILRTTRASTLSGRASSSFRAEGLTSTAYLFTEPAAFD
jgi:hypothetical protein